MRNKDIVLAIGGLILGIALGAFILGRIFYPDQSTELSNLRSQVTDLESQVVQAQSTASFRTVNEAAATSDFFVVTFDQTEKWLESLELELSDELKEQLLGIQEAIANGDITADTIEKIVADEESDAYLILKLIYDEILKATNTPTTAQAPAIAACIGVQDDVYTGVQGYLYLQMPRGLGDGTMKIVPTKERVAQAGEWQKLDSPMPQSMLWTSACYEGEKK